MKPTILLASSSPSRQAQLTQLDLPFTVLSPDVDESPLPNEAPIDMAKRLAYAKAQKAKSSLLPPDIEIIIAGDQTGFTPNLVLSKPESYQEAFEMIQAMRGQKVTICSGVCVIDLKSQQTWNTVVSSHIFLRNYPDSMIEQYLAKEPHTYCLGALKIEGRAIKFVERIEADDHSAIIGLPLITLCTILETLGVLI